MFHSYQHNKLKFPIFVCYDSESFHLNLVHKGRRLSLAMNVNCSLYVSKTTIPDFLKPLPKIKFDVYRKYRTDFYNPKSLVLICCKVLEDNFRVSRGNENIVLWEELIHILRMSSQIYTDSCYKLCNIKNYKNASQYLMNKAFSSEMSISNLLLHYRIIMKETTEQIRFNELANHWARIPLGRPRYPCIMFGRPSKGEQDGIKARLAHRRLERKQHDELLQRKNDMKTKINQLLL